MDDSQSIERQSSVFMPHGGASQPSAPSDPTAMAMAPLVPPDTARSTLSSATTHRILDGVHNSTPDQAAKVLYKVASDLVKYEVLDKNGVSRRGLLKNTMPIEDYKNRVVILLKTINTMPCPLAVTVSSQLRTFKDSARIATQLKDYNKGFEQKSSRPSENCANPNVSVFMFDNDAKFAKMEAVFSGVQSKVEELFATDTYLKQCNEIERLLRGEDVESDTKRHLEEEEDSGNLSRLSDLLRSITTADGRLCPDPRAAGFSMGLR